MSLVLFFVFVTGIAIGSFLNVVGLRVPNKESIVSPGSSCPDCKYELKYYDLVPIFSYLFLEGKCRKCKSKISGRYALVEFLTGLSFVFVYLHSDSLAHFGFQALMVSVLMALSVSDLEYRLIPNKILLYSFIVLIPFGIWISDNTLLDHVIAGGGVFAILLLITVVTNGGMGGGDIKLLTVIGFALGMKEIILIFMIACFAGAFVGIALKMARKNVKELPFAPFIYMGAVIVMVYSESLWNVLVNR